MVLDKFIEAAASALNNKTTDVVWSKRSSFYKKKRIAEMTIAINAYNKALNDFVQLDLYDHRHYSKN